VHRTHKNKLFGDVMRSCDHIRVEASVKGAWAVCMQNHQDICTICGTLIENHHAIQSPYTPAGVVNQAAAIPPCRGGKRV
jgi:hypothetical protein